jgi:hypothetical protein
LGKNGFWALAAVSAIGMLGLAGIASGAGLKTKSATVSITQSEQVSVAAKCKRGQKAISGGFDASDFDPETNRPVVNFASRKKGARKWSASAVEWGSGTRSVTAFAYCRKGGKVTKRKKTTTVPSLDDEQGTATLAVKCKRGQKVVSGGYAIRDFFVDEGDYTREGYAYSSRKTGGREWTVKALNYSEEDVILDAFAYCRESEGVKAESAETSIDTDDAAAATAECDAGQRVISGGFDNSDFDPDAGAQIVPLSSAKTGQGSWTAAGWNEGGDEGTFTAYAYCEKK